MITVEPRSDGRSAVVHVDGEAGIHQADLIDKHIKVLAKRSEAIVVLDLSRLNFASSVWIAAMIALQKDLKSRGATMRVAGMSSTILGTLRRCKLDEQFSTFDTVDSALHG